jgi:hypothetical protein
MLTKDIRKLAEAGTEVAVVPRAVIQQHSGIRAHGAMRARIAEVYDEPKQAGRYRDEKVIARVIVTEDDRSSGASVGTEYEVAARRIIGTWTEREETLAADRAFNEEYRTQLAQAIAESQAKADSLNERQRAAGLLVKPPYGTEPVVYMEFYVNQSGGLQTRRNINDAALIERLLHALGGS